MAHQKNRPTRELFNACALAGAIGSINERLGTEVLAALTPILDQGRIELERLAGSYAQRGRANRHLLAETAVSDFFTWVIERSSIGGHVPDKGPPKAFLCAVLRYSVYAGARAQDRASLLPIGHDDDFQQVGPEGVWTPTEVLAVARETLPTLHPARQALLKRLYPFLDEGDAGIPVGPHPTPPPLPGYARSRALKGFLHRVQTRLGLPLVTIGEAKARGTRRRRRRRAKPRVRATPAAVTKPLRGPR